MPAKSRAEANRIAIRVAVLYAVSAGTWILLSDRFVQAIGLSTTGPAATAKGFVFIGVTSAVLYFGVRSWAQRLDAEQRRALDNERALAQLARSVPVGIIMVDGIGTVTFMNGAAAGMLGLDTADCIGRPLTVLASGFPTPDTGRLLARVALLAPGSKSELQLPGGEPGRTLLVNAEHVNTSEPARGRVYTLSDVTDAVLVGQRNQRLLSLQRFLTDVALTVSRTHDAQHLISDVARLAIDKGGFSAAWFVWADPVSGQYTTISSIGLDEHGDLLRLLLDGFAIRQSPMTDAFRAGEIFIANAVSSIGGPFQALASDESLGSCAAVPFVESGATVAGLTLFAPTQGFFGAEELQTLRTLQAAVTFGVERVALDRRRVEAEEALERSEVAYRRLFEQNPQPMWVYDLETLRFLAVNEAAVRKYGYSREEFSGMTIADIRPSEDVAALEANVISVVEGIDEAGVWRHMTKDGRVLAVDITSHTVDWSGRAAELVMARDVTGLYEAEAELIAHADRLCDAISERSAQLVQLGACVDACVAAPGQAKEVAMDVRPQLNGLVGFSAVVLRDLEPELTAEQASALRDIGAEGRRLLGVLADLDEIARLEDGSLMSERVSFDLADALGRIVIAVRPTAESAGTFLSLDAEGPLRVSGDPRHTHRVTRWLVDDALRRGQGGSVDITARVEGSDALVTVRARGGQHVEALAEPSNEVLLARRLGRVLAGGRPAVATDGEVAVFRFPVF